MSVYVSAEPMEPEMGVGSLEVKLQTAVKPLDVGAGTQTQIL